MFGVTLMSGPTIRMHPQFLSGSVHVAVLFATIASATTQVTVDGSSSHKIPPLLYGISLEDVNAIDGGLYAELLQNRAFQQVTPGTDGALYAWSTIGGAGISVITDPAPVSSALLNSLQVALPTGNNGQVGFANSGYNGIALNSDWTYNASFYYKFPTSSSFEGVATISFLASTGELYGSATVPISGSQTTWKQVAVSLTPTSSPGSTENSFTVTFDGTAAAGQTINFAMFSLFPPTFKGRANGMRIDLATLLYDLQPSFVRFPGGRNLGQTLLTRWIWDATIGALVDRPGRMGTWGYVNTDGVGLLDYLYFCEDLGAEPIMAVWAGFTLDGEKIADIEPYVQSTVNQINFVIADASTNEYGALRASLGHPEPFKLTYVEIGNQDYQESESYITGWNAFVEGLGKAFPQLQFIATTRPFNPTLNPTPQQYDNHIYSTADYFVQNAFYYDGFKRTGTYYLQGEYSAISGSNGGLVYPTVQSSVAEAAYMTGFERNADIVLATAYAPTLLDVASYQMAPALIAFDTLNVYPSTSYYVQQLFSSYRGTEYLPSTLPDSKGTLHWSVTRDTNAGLLNIKVVNYNTVAETISFTLKFNVASTGQVAVLTGSVDTSNTPTTPSAALITTTSMNFGQTFEYTAPAYSVSALSVKIT